MELCLMVLFTVFIIQQSSLYMSVLLVPFSFILMLSIKEALISSGLMLFVFVMVFIGGLLVLLVSVSSLATQEQGVLGGLLSVMGPLIILILVVPETSIALTEVSTALMLWVQDTMTLTFVTLLLVVSLMVISLLVFQFKGLVRSICLLGVKHASFSLGSSSGRLTDN